MRGVVIKIPDTTPGLIVVDDQQLPFELVGQWRSPVAPALNQVVEVECDEGGSIVAIRVLDSTVALERSDGTAVSAASTALTDSTNFDGECPHCRTPLPVGATTCPSCGAYQVPWMSMPRQLFWLFACVPGSCWSGWKISGTFWDHPRDQLGPAAAFFGIGVVASFIVLWRSKPQKMWRPRD